MRWRVRTTETEIDPRRIGDKPAIKGAEDGDPPRLPAIGSCRLKLKVVFRIYRCTTSEFVQVTDHRMQLVSLPIEGSCGQNHFNEK